MKIKTFGHEYDESYENFDKRVNDFIESKQVIQIIQITTNEPISDTDFTHSLTVLYKDE